MTGFYHRWMVIWCWIMINIGAVFALSIFGALRGPTMMFLDIVFWPIDGQPAVLSREAVLGTALVGAVMIGWGVLMLGLVRDEKLAREPRVWSIMTTAVVLWFVIDSTCSVIGGAGVNALSNAVFLATFLYPVLKSGVLSGGIGVNRTT